LNSVSFGVKQGDERHPERPRGLGVSGKGREGQLLPHRATDWGRPSMTAHHRISGQIPATGNPAVSVDLEQTSRKTERLLGFLPSVHQ
jgi:hypothetical protein